MPEGLNSFKEVEGDMDRPWDRLKVNGGLRTTHSK